MRREREKERDHTRALDRARCDPVFTSSLACFQLAAPRVF
jgi:hypothetical protein